MPLENFLRVKVEMSTSKTTRTVIRTDTTTATTTEVSPDGGGGGLVDTGRQALGQIRAVTLPSIINEIALDCCRRSGEVETSVNLNVTVSWSSEGVQLVSIS